MKINNDFKKVLATVASVIGVLSSLMTFFTSSFNRSGILLGTFILVLTGITILVIMRWMPKGNLPTDLLDVSEELEREKKDARFKIVFPCDSKYYRAANKLAKQKFGKHSVSSKTIDDWKNRNEYILTCLTDNNRMVGYFDILPLKTEFALELINGSKGEEDIQGKDLLPIDQIKNAEYIYFAGIAVKDTHSGQGCIHGTYLLASAVQYVNLLYNNSNVKKILTIPTSECGLKITNKLNFVLEREGLLRKDGHDLYSKDFDLNEIKSLIQSKARLYNRFDLSSYYHTIQKFVQ